MAFCSDCGERITDSMKFCSNCGASTASMTTDDFIKRKKIFDGNMHKCPSCGEVLDSFVANCSACGYELRGSFATSAVRELYTKLEAVESSRETVQSKPLKNRHYGKTLGKTDEQKITLIRSFPIPNTKEDLYEFLILSESNIEIDLYDDSIKKTDARLAVSDAWKAKFEQAYQKAKLVFANDSKLSEIQALYDATHKSIKKAKSKDWKITGIIFGVVIVINAIIFIIVVPTLQKNETTRLEGIIENIEITLDDGEYKLALMYADSLIAKFGSADEYGIKWEIQREYWIDKIIKEAAENGVFLERPTEKTNEDPTTTTYEGGFINGFKDGISSVMEEVQGNIDIFNENLKGVNDNLTQTSENVISDFTAGYEEADFSKYNTHASENGLDGTKIYIKGTLEKIEILEADGTKTLLGYITDSDGNTWLIIMHIIPEVTETHFNATVGKEVICTVIYGGYSSVKEMPSTTLNELLDIETGTIYNGMQKLLDE